MQFFGVLPLTGRQLMYGFIGFLVLFIALQQALGAGRVVRGRDARRGDHDVEAVEPGARVEALADRAGARASSP